MMINNGIYSPSSPATVSASKRNECAEAFLDCIKNAAIVEKKI